MKRKHFIFALVAMLWSFSFTAFAAGDVIVVNNEAELRTALAGGVQRASGLQRSAALQSADAQSDEPQPIRFGSDVTLTAPFETNVGGNYVLDLEGYALRGAAIDGTKHQYPFYNRGTLIIKDSQGGGYIDCGVYNGYDTDGVTYSEARLEMVSGKIVCHDDEGAAIINYGTTIISGGSVEGSVNALKNVSGTMTVADGVSITGEVAGEVTISTGVKFTVAKIGDNVYATFGEALAAANAMTGDVTMQIFGEVEFTDGMELNGSYTSINFVGKSAKAKMTVNQTAGGDYLTAHGKTVTFTDLTLAKANPAWQGNSGHMSQYFSIQGGTVTYTDCTFLNGACTSGGTATYTDCTFQNAEGQYGLWAYDDAVVTVNGGTIDSKKGIKVYSEDEASVTTTLTVQNATFTENVTAKPAVAIGYAESITLIGNTYNNTAGVLELDSGSDADCEGITFVAQDNNGNDISSTITATDRSNSDAPCGVLVDGKIYTTVTEAAKEATETSTVTLLHSSDEVVEFPMGATIETNGYTADNVTTAQPFADYVVLPISMTVNNYKAMFGDNTVTDGTNYYATLQVAVEAVAGKPNTILYCKPGADVGSLQHAPVTSTLTVYGNNANVTGDTERDFDLGNTDPNFGKDITADMTLTVKHLNGCGAWGTKATEHTVNLVFENCANMGKVFINGTTGTLNITMTDCAFEGVIKEAVYSNANGAITLTNVAFANLNKAVNLNHKAAGTQTVTIDGCSFTNCGADVANDQIPVRVLSSVSSGKSVLTVNNTTFTGTPAGGADILLADGVGVTEATVTNTAANVKPGDTAEMVAVATQDSYEYNNIVAKIGNVEYASLQGAIDAVTNGDEIILVADCDEAITFTQTKDVSFVLNGNDKTMTGNINITARAGKDAPSTLVIKNFNFETDKISHDFINSVATNYYPNNITIQDCTFKGTSDISTEGYAVVAVRLKSANNITIKNCTGTGLHSFLQNTAGWNLTIDNVDVDGAAEGGFALGTVQGVTIESCDINAGRYGIRLDGGYNNNAVIADNKIEAFIPVVVRYASVDGTLTFNGTNVFTQTNNDGYWCVIGTTEYVANGALPTDATAKIKVSLNDTGLEAEGLYGNFVPTAKIGEAEYATLADAIAAVKNGETITLVAGVEEDVTVVQAPDVAFTIDGNNNTFKGTITVDGKSAAYATAGVTIKNVNFVAATNAVCINLGVSGNNNTRYTSNVTVDGCTFTGTDYTAVGIKSYTGGDKNLTVTNCTATKMHSLMQLKNVAGVNVANCTIEDSKNGIALGASSNVAVTETTMDCEGYGVRADANAAANATITDCNITAFIPVVVRKASADYNLTFAGDNTMTAENSDMMWCIVGQEEYGDIKDDGTVITLENLGETTGKVKVTLNEEDTDLDIAGVYGNFGVASITRDNKVINYLSLAEALDAALDGETVNLHWTAGDAPISMAGTVCGNKTVTITGTANVDWSKGFFFVGRGGEGDGKVIFNNAHLTSVSNSSAYGFNVSGSKAGDNQTNNGVVELVNSTIVLDYMLNKGTMSLDNSTLTVKNGFSVTGRKASESATGEDATATMTLANNSKVVVNNYNGMGIGHEAYGVMNIDATSSFEATQNFAVAANGTMNIAGKASVAGTLTNNGAINFTSDVATLTTATTGLTIGYNVDPDKKVVYAEGAYKVVDKLYVAQTDAAQYESLQEAIENVADNGTVTLLSDVTVTEAAYGQNALNHARAINFTLDLNGKKLSADTGNSVFRFNIGGSGATSDVTVTVKNGTVVSGANTWCTLMASGISVDVKAVMNLEDLTIENYKGGDFAVKAWANGVVNAKNVTINASYGGGFYALGGEIVLDNCTVEQKGLWTAPYNSMTVGVSDGGKMTVNSGTYSAVPAAVADGNNQGTSHGSWCGGVMSSGGTLIINGGTFSNGNIDGTASNPRELFIIGADADYGDNVAARLEINGGTFNSIGALTHCETIWGSANDAANTYMPTMDVVITAGDFTGVAGKTIGGCDPISTGNPVEVVISGGTYSANHAIDNSYLADAYIIVDNGNSTYTVSNGTVKVGETYYASLEAGLKALTDGATLTFIEDITVTEAWDCRYNGAKVTAANVTIDGNGKTLKIAGAVDDRNWNTVFRFEGDNATVKNLTIDASAATGIDRGITSKLSVTVDKCTLIGNGTTANRAIIFGEGAGTSISNVVATVTNSTFKNWSYGVSDNQNAQDAKNVTVTGNIFENASVRVSASDQVVFSNNTLTDGGVNITSYTNVENVSVQAFNNTLDAEEINKITTNPARHMISGEGFSTPVAKMDGKYYVSIQDAVDSSTATATGSEIILTVNRYLDMDEAVVIEGKVVTLNLNGKIVRATADAQMTGGIFRLLDGADLTITGEGEINYNGNANVYAAVGILGAANLTVENSKLVGYYYGITGNGLKDGSTITINGGEISSVEGTGSGIYHPQNGTLTVTGGTVTGATGIYFKSGVLNITDGTINGTGAKVAYGHNGNGSDATGDALVIENVAAGNYEAVTSVAVTGGSFNSVNADPIASYAADGATALTQFVTGGTFNKTFSEECLPVGYQLKDYDSNGYYNVELTNTRESMTFVDGEFTEYTIATDMNIGTLTYKRANVPTTWAAFYFPFEVPVSQLADQGFEVAYINGVRRNDTDFDGELDKFVMEVIYIHGGESCDGSGKTLKANYPYFIRAKEEAKDLEIVLEGATLYAAYDATYDCTTFTEKFEITGNTSQVSINSTNDRLIYAVSTVGEWTNITKGATLKPFRFYMALTSRYENEPIAPVATMSIAVRGEEREDGTTFIYDVEMDGEQTIDYIYDLQGRRVLEPQKGGLYIVNGKKVVF